MEGQLIAILRRWAPRQGRVGAFVYGGMIMLISGAVVLSLVVLLQQLLNQLPWMLRVVLEAAIFKTCFSLRGLASAARQVQQALIQQDLPQARHLLSWHLVSRDTTVLNASEISAATIESVAENASDSLVAPLLYYAIGGLPGALLYRLINTADAMLGYRDPEREWLGKIPARLDDLVNLIPARLTAGCILVVAFPYRYGAKETWRIWRRDAKQTASSNAGHPMSAMAGALGVELVKIEHYRLGDGLKPPVQADIARSIVVLYGITIVSLMLCSSLIVIQ
ncbi:cobalamin biosynthesis protein CobD [Candidatus Entotheonella serta]|nr:cobalamin biosynthesis protein CobD [Candidatus Entotheonella serta]